MNFTENVKNVSASLMPPSGGVAHLLLKLQYSMPHLFFFLSFSFSSQMSEGDSSPVIWSHISTAELWKHVSDVSLPPQNTTAAALTPQMFSLSSPVSNMFVFFLFQVLSSFAERKN